MPGIRIGVSACLLGQSVRYDGTDKRDRFITDELGRYVQFVAVCPEVESGMGVPRETLRLVRGPSGLRMFGNDSGRDYTGQMRRYAKRRARELERLGLCGYIVKKGSPSCGLARVRCYTPAGRPAPSARGLFAEELVARLSHLPIEEEGRLCDGDLRENFLVRVFAYARLRELFRPRWKLRDLVAFHAREQLLLMAHDPRAERAIGRIVADASRYSRRQVADAYKEAFMRALQRRATRARHVNVLQHAAGCLSDVLETSDNAELRAAIADYGRGIVPLVVATTLLRHHLRKHGVDDLMQQTYLFSHPYELMLRNHA